MAPEAHDFIAPAAAALDDKDPALDLDDIQGDVLLGLQKKAEDFIFFSIKDVALFR